MREIETFEEYKIKQNKELRALLLMFTIFTKTTAQKSNQQVENKFNGRRRCCVSAMVNIKTIVCVFVRVSITRVTLLQM